MTMHKNSKYKHVQGLYNERFPDKIRWVVHMKGYGRNGFETEKQAAIAVDKILISKGKEPVNVLIRK